MSEKRAIIPRAGSAPVGTDAVSPWTPRDLAASIFPAPAADTPASREIQALRAEVQSLQTELNQLRRRDETLRFLMTRLDEEMRLAARLQQDFLPRNFSQLGRFSFHTLFRPAEYVSGDLYDVMRLDETHVGLIVVDAVGHGMPAALLTMFLKRALVTKEICANGYRLLSPAQSIEGMNNALIEQQLAHATFATAVYAVLNIATLELSYCSAGHPPPVILRRDQFISLPAGDGLLGIFPDEHYTACDAVLEPGDRLMLYSDGLEVGFADGSAAANQRWRQEILDRRDMPTGQMLVEFSRRLDNETGSLMPEDDITLIIAEATAA